MDKTSVSTLTVSIILLIVIILANFSSLISVEIQDPDPPLFEYTTPEIQGIPSISLTALTEEVKKYYEEESITGAELVVIKNNDIILHEAFGWKDRENNEPMKKNTLFNIRSMTKPITGTAVQILIEQGEIKMNDYVSEYIPGFDNEKSRNITVEQLLSHMSGLPLSILVAADDFDTLNTLANEIGRLGPEYPPGSKFWYSDSGTEVLGEIVQVVSGMSLDDYVTENILKPLEMNNSFYYTPKTLNDTRRMRIASLYLGGEGSWVKAWSFDEPLYPFALGSQSLYCTPLDYARFLYMFMNGDVNKSTSLIPEEAINRVLTPVTRMKLLGSDTFHPTGFWNLEVYYGQLMTVYQQKNVNEASKTILFGHTGSDGTYAWAWPEQDLMVLYFTQSRGSTSGLKLEALIDEHLVHQELKEINAEALKKYHSYLGTYTADFGVFQNAEFTVTVQNGRLAIDIPDQFIFELEEPDMEGKWFFKMFEDVAVSFEYTLKGNVTMMKLHQYGYTFELPKKSARIQEYPQDLQKYTGFYQTEDPTVRMEILIENEKLLLEIPGQPVKFELSSPDKEGLWRIKLNPTIAISFQESDYGEVTSITMHLPDGSSYIHPRLVDK